MSLDPTEKNTLIDMNVCRPQNYDADRSTQRVKMQLVQNSSSLVDAQRATK